MKVYVVSLQFATDDADGVDIEVFGTYDKAVKRFKELIENEKNPKNRQGLPAGKKFAALLSAMQSHWRGV